jgi:hypothetical protein
LGKDLLVHSLDKDPLAVEAVELAKLAILML